MKIVVKKEDSSIAMVGDVPSVEFDPAVYDTHDIPGWDWSLVDLSAVERYPTPPKTFLSQLMWDGEKIVKRP